MAAQYHVALVGSKPAQQKPSLLRAPEIKNIRQPSPIGYHSAKVHVTEGASAKVLDHPPTPPGGLGVKGK